MLPEYAKNTIIEVHKTKVGRGEPHIENVDNELVTCGNARASECRVSGTVSYTSRRK